MVDIGEGQYMYPQAKHYIRLATDKLLKISYDVRVAGCTDMTL
jgi:hypothetical protein